MTARRKKEINSIIPTAVRFFLFGNQILGFEIMKRILKPDKKKLRAALAAGIVSALYDFTIEALAYKNDLWYCYGGIQKIKIGKKEIDFLHVPLEMVIGFIYYGMTISLLSDDGVTALVRSLTPQVVSIRSVFLRGHKALDYRYRNKLRLIPFIIFNSMLGAAGDFASKKVGMWENAPEWKFFHTAFLAWASLISLTLFTYRSLS